MPTAPDASPQVFTTPFTKLFGINHPISLAGQAAVSDPFVLLVRFELVLMTVDRIFRNERRGRS
jgi:hypothetical protein